MFAAIKAWFGHVIEDFKAWRRGETRVSPRGTFGRVYARTAADPSAIAVKAEPTATLTMTIIRADGTTEVITVPATVTQVPNNG